MANNFKQGYYNLRYPEKYVETGQNRDKRGPKFLSSYEERVFNWADLNDNVVKWCSECVIVPYKMREWSEKLSQYIIKEHKYYTDLYCEIKDKKGNILKYIIEVKPLKQVLEPVPAKKATKKSKTRFLNEQAVYMKNSSKWAAANEYAKEVGMTFKILTEEEIFNKPRKKKK